jgi:nucleotide-binding universal stress UspA family protein
VSLFQTILITTDFSEVSRRAVEPAVVLAEKFGSRILVLYVVEDRLPPFVDEYTGISLEEILKAHTERARKEMDRFVEQNLPGRPNVESLVVHGMPSSEIVRVAEDRRADLLVMATHGRGFVSHALFGSTTERVLRRAPCPVLTVRGS